MTRTPYGMTTLLEEVAPLDLEVELSNVDGLRVARTVTLSGDGVTDVLDLVDHLREDVRIKAVDVGYGSLSITFVGDQRAEDRSAFGLSVIYEPADETFVPCSPIPCPPIEEMDILVGSDEDVESARETEAILDDEDATEAITEAGEEV